MNQIEEALLYATIMHTGATRKGTRIPYILHPAEVAQIVSTMTDDIDIITASVLHDVVEDTEGTLVEIEKRFGKRVAELVDADTEIRKEMDTWQVRKGRSIAKLQNTKDRGARMIWLGDKLSNIRSIHRQADEMGSDVWQLFHEKDPQLHRWYYKTIAEALEVDFNKTAAFKEFIRHINDIWPGTFSPEKTSFKEYRKMSLDGLEVIGKGAKSTVYRVDDELILKVYNDNYLFKDIERENRIAKKALIADIPTAISFGIVTIGDRYGLLFELINSSSVSELIAKDPANVATYAKIMADLALQIHKTKGDSMELPEYMPNVQQWVYEGIAYIDKDLTQKVNALLQTIPQAFTIIHGDFHTGNVMKQGNEFLLIDMDRLSICHPIIELSGIYTFYVALGELDPSVVESFMGFSYETAVKYFDLFMKYYMGAVSITRMREVKNMVALIAYVRMVRKCFKNGPDLSEKDQKACDYYVERIRELLEMPLSF